MNELLSRKCKYLGKLYENDIERAGPEKRFVSRTLVILHISVYCLRSMHFSASLNFP